MDNRCGPSFGADLDKRSILCYPVLLFFCPFSHDQEVIMNQASTQKEVPLRQRILEGSNLYRNYRLAARADIIDGAILYYTEVPLAGDHTSFYVSEIRLCYPGIRRCPHSGVDKVHYKNSRFQCFTDLEAVIDPNHRDVSGPYLTSLFLVKS